MMNFDEINILDNNKLDTVEISSLELNKFWDITFPLSSNLMQNNQARNIFFVSLIKYSNEELDYQLNFFSGGWTINIKKSILITALTTASLSSLLYLINDNIILSSYILPAVLPLLFNIEKVKLSNKDNYILAELVFNQEIIEKKLTSEEIYNKLDESIKDQLNYLDFLDFLEKINLAGYTASNEYTYQINKKQKIKITFI